MMIRRKKEEEEQLQSMTHCLSPALGGQMCCRCGGWPGGEDHLVRGGGGVLVKG